MSARLSYSDMSRLHTQDLGTSISLQMLHGIGCHEIDNDQTDHMIVQSTNHSDVLTLHSDQPRMI